MEEASGKHVSTSASGDRLSGLPDSLLHDVLSRLKSRQTVQTCVLSRRWRHLWRSVPCLDLDVMEFLPLAPPPSRRAESRSDLEAVEVEEDLLDRFEDFADALLAHRGGTSSVEVHTLRLRAISSRWSRPTERLVRRGLERSSPVELHILGSLRWPRFVSSSSSSDASTARLRKLRLDHVHLNHRFEEHLASGLFPVLEELELRNALFLTGITRLASATLKELFIENCRVARSVDIVAPRLASLRLLVRFCGKHSWDPERPTELGISIGDSPSLVRASIGVLDEHHHNDENAFQDWLRSVCEFIRGFVCNVETLELSGLLLVRKRQAHDLRGKFDVMGPMLQMILVQEEHKAAPTVFRNLRTLILDECEIHVNNNLEALWCFLRNAPVLEKLTLRYQKLEPASFQERFLVNVPDMGDRKDMSSISTSLKLIQIQHGDRVDDKRLDKILSEILRELPEITVQVTKVDFVSMSSFQRCLSSWEGTRLP